MAVQVSVDWLTCDQDGCIGISLDAGDKCLAHARGEERDAALRHLKETGSLDARGVPISRRLGEQIVAAAPVEENGLRWFMNVDFTRATFEDNYAGFWGARFYSQAKFDGVKFQGDVDFSGSWFWRGAEFSGAKFENDVRYNLTRFKDVVNFTGADFYGSVAFVEASFEDLDLAMFDKATFLGPQGWQCSIQVRGLLSLDDTQFSGPVRITAAAKRLSCRRARFLGGVRFDVRGAFILLDDADLSVPSLLTGPPPPDEGEPPPDDGQPPKLVSLQRANVAGLGLANVDLTDCRFAGAHNLDKLRLEANVVFGRSPARAGWERRQVIAEESAWRYKEAHDNSTGNGAAPLHGLLRAGSLPLRRTRRALAGRWPDPAWDGWAENNSLADPKPPKALKPGAIVNLYRALRKGREDAKDEPGAADFYYGEMEMRRHMHGRAERGDSGSRGRVDRGVLTAYWLVSGYGLRAWRAIAWLAGITVAFALAFHLVGFSHPPQPASYWTSLLYAFRSTISLTDSQVTLTAWGQVLQALLRLSGPVLLGLALLAFRGRIKR